jgi:hypothetical protein
VRKVLILAIIALVASACGGRQVTRVVPLAESADVPYENVLVVALFSSFDRRRIFERAVVDELSQRGIRAVASTSKMTTKTPLSRDTFVAMVRELGSDGVLVTQLVDADTSGKVKTMRPEATYNVSPTRYFNVWNVDYTEYREPPDIESKTRLILGTQMFSAATQEPVWIIETATTVKRNIADPMDFSLIVDEADAIVGELARDGLIPK